ncbi:hypothetical protein ACSD7O_25055 [Methylorubrum extorquens]|uniref:hypothetical protein n=1 Tax=Methylorubrum extorquens TaxID=408 RepID=UPI003F6460E1
MTPAITPELRERAGKDRPIIFSAPMVRALIEGRKTQTRRVLRWQPDPVPDYHSGPFRNADGVWGQTIWEPGNVEQFCPLRLPAVAGDRLWVKEEARRSPDVWAYTTDGTPVPWPGRGDLASRKRDICNSMFLPRSCSRLTLEVTEVRVERLQDISEADAEAEGLWRGRARRHLWWVNATECRLCEPHRSHKAAFGDLWSRINGPASWDANPWVAAISFRVILANIDAPPASPLATGEAA